MSDRELLEFAAKAAGYKKYFANHLGRYSFVTYEEKRYSMEKNSHVVCEKTLDWNPLDDDGDALRLAVKTGLGVIQWRLYVSATHGPTGMEWLETLGSDPCAATRRAIVRAAAEIGRQVQEGGAA